MQTVSRVINDYPQVTAATRARVRSALQDLAYRPNPAARSLVTGRSRLIGVVTNGLDDSGSADLLAGVEAEAAENGYEVAIACVSSLSALDVDDAVHRLLQHPIDGLVMLGVGCSTAERTPPAFIAMITVDPDHGDLILGDRRGARLAVRHLLDSGHRQVWHIAGASNDRSANAREAGWRDELRSVGIDPPTATSGDGTARSGYEVGAELALNHAVTAVFAATDDMALGAMAAFRDAGRVVPVDVAVVGYGDRPYSAFAAPPLTTVRHDHRQAGREAMSALDAQLEPREHPQSPGTASTDSPVLIRRASTAAPYLIGDSH